MARGRLRYGEASYHRPLAQGRALQTETTVDVNRIRHIQESRKTERRMTTINLIQKTSKDQAGTKREFPAVESETQEHDNKINKPLSIKGKSYIL